MLSREDLRIRLRLDSRARAKADERWTHVATCADDASASIYQNRLVVRGVRFHRHKNEFYCPATETADAIAALSDEIVTMPSGWVCLAHCASVDECVALQYRLWEREISYRVENDVVVYVDGASVHDAAALLREIWVVYPRIPRVWAVRRRRRH